MSKNHPPRTIRCHAPRSPAVSPENTPAALPDRILPSPPQQTKWWGSLPPLATTRRRLPEDMAQTPSGTHSYAYAHQSHKNVDEERAALIQMLVGRQIVDAEKEESVFPSTADSLPFLNPR
ncbi:hypothetical protein PQX77_013847 [Marasmius sp. AFHP31]|nr:hypothetical protein PQX77_013847 [Marasmius sp. AFHP31]